jgi:bisanhydrobacterioruberin hydratase
MAVVFGGGVLAHVWPQLHDWSLAATTPLLILTNAAVLLEAFDTDRARRLRWWCLGAWLITVVLEMIGVATGRLFGAYHYGPTLRGQLAGVPLLIGLNWTTLLLGALAAADARLTPRLSRSARLWVVPTAAALLLTAFDWVMEPVAVALNYWSWHTWPAIPLQNYGAWFGIAWVLGLMYVGLGLRARAALAQYYFLIQAAFFLLLRSFLP